jgi:hypothetical protein
MPGTKKTASTKKGADKEKTAAPAKTIECPQCKKVHEVDAARDGVQFTCECGHVLDTDPLAKAKTGGGGARKSLIPAAWKTRIVTLAKNWKISAPVGAGVVALTLAAIFFHGPTFVLGGGFRGHGTGLTSQAQENPEPYLKTLEDNSRQAEHLKAAAELLGMHDSTIVPRLCELAARDGLASHKLVLQLLGQLGSDRALQTLEQLSGGADLEASRQAVASITQIGTPTAESVVTKLIAQPAKARDLLETIAAVRNDTAGRVISSCFQRPALRSQAIDLAGRFRLARCTEPLSAVARDRDLSDEDRLAGIEALGRINQPESRRILRSLVEDSTVGYKAREIIGKNNNDGGY